MPTLSNIQKTGVTILVLRVLKIDPCSQDILGGVCGIKILPHFKIQKEWVLLGTKSSMEEEISLCLNESWSVMKRPLCGACE